MSQGSLGRRLSAQDASFLYGERAEAPLHIGSIAVFEGDVSYERFVANIASKLHLIPRYQQRVVPTPLNISHPTWEWDPDFDLHRHIKQIDIESPGTDAQLLDLGGRLFQGMLDRNKPLWEMYLVRGLEGGRSALVSKVHHCLVDGVSGIELLMVVLDISPNPATPLPPVEQPERSPIPDPLRLLVDGILDNISAGVDRWAASQNRFWDTVFAADDRARSVLRSVEAALPYLVDPAARAPFNKPIGGERKLAVNEFSFAEIRAIRAECGGTVNDVVLTVLGGGLGRYLEMHGEKTEGRSVRILTPVNVRRDDERGALGNRVSMLLVEVPVGERDPLERLRVVNERTDRLKRRNVAAGIEAIGQAMNDGAPPMLQALAGTLRQPPNTLANLICTNVPGPMIPLYTVGHRMLAHYPMVPLSWEMGIGCGVTSYDQKLYFGLLADPAIASDVDRLKEFVDQAFVELRSAAGVGRIETPAVGMAAPQVVPRRRRAASGAPAEALAADTA